MRKNKNMIRALSAAAACALLIPAFGISASAAEINEDETFPVPSALAKASKDDAPLGTSNLPSAYNSVDLGYVSPAKNQKYNDCWVYGALGTYESFLLKNGLYNGDMSVDHANLWGTQRDNEEGWMRSYTDFGRAKIMPGYFTSWQGPVNQSKLPVIDFSIDTPDSIPTDLTDYGVKEIRYLSREDPDTIKRAIMESGGISTYYIQAAQYMNYETYSYYSPPDSTGGSGHAVEIVGWDDNYSASNFNDEPQGNGAWIVKNSWGDFWGDNGCFRISYYDKDIFNASKFKPSFQIMSVEPITDKMKYLQNEIFGATWEFDYIKEPELTAFQTFDFDGDYPMLDKVIFESISVGSAYSVYYVPDKNGVPDSDENAWTELYSSTVDYPGYICADFDDFEVPNGEGSVAVRIGSPASGGTPSVGVCEWLTSSGTFTFFHQAQKDQSYVTCEGQILDLTDWYKQKNSDDYGGTFSIKALTKKRPPQPGDVNLDGVVDISDATVLQKHIALLTELDDEALAVADMNKDGFYTISDVTLIQRAAAEITE